MVGLLTSSVVIVGIVVSFDLAYFGVVDIDVSIEGTNFLVVVVLVVVLGEVITEVVPGVASVTLRVVVSEVVLREVVVWVVVDVVGFATVTCI